MWTIIVSAVVGGIIATSISGTRKLYKIRRLKGENKMLHERNEACAKELMEKYIEITRERDKTRDLRRDLALWQCLANEIVKHPAPPNSPHFKTVPETGVHLLQFYKSKLDSK